MNRILPTLKKHDPFATRYMDITETPHDSSSSTFSFGPEYLMNVVIFTSSSFIDPSFTTTTTE